MRSVCNSLISPLGRQQKALQEGDEPLAETSVSARRNPRPRRRYRHRIQASWKQRERTGEVHAQIELELVATVRAAAEEGRSESEGRQNSAEDRQLCRQQGSART